MLHYNAVCCSQDVRPYTYTHVKNKRVERGYFGNKGVYTEKVLEPLL